MSRKPKVKNRLNAAASDAKGIKFLRGRDPAVMGPMLQTLAPRRAVFSWLTPGVRLIGLPPFADPDMPWLTMIDDLDHDAAGPPSFDPASLQWWAEQAQVFLVDAATPRVHLYKKIARLAADGYLVLAVQTIEERRLVWHKHFATVHPPGEKACVFHQIKSLVLGGPEQVVRMGTLSDDFEAARPVLSGGKLITNTIH
jgi:hypothetical protein